MSKSGRVSRVVVAIDVIALLVICVAALRYASVVAWHGSVTAPIHVPELSNQNGNLSLAAALTRAQTAAIQPLTTSEKVAIFRLVNTGTTSQSLSPAQRAAIIKAMNSK